MYGMSEEIAPVESKTRTYHGLVGSGRRTAGRGGGAGQDRTPTERFAQETTVPRTFQGIEHTYPELLPRSTNKRNPMYSGGGTKSAFDCSRLITKTTAALRSLWFCTPKYAFEPD